LSRWLLTFLDRRGTLVPLYPTLAGQVVAIAREYGLPSTGGIVLYLVEDSHVAPAPPGLAGVGGPRIGEEAWTLLWAHLFEEDDEPVEFDDFDEPPVPPIPAGLRSEASYAAYGQPDDTLADEAASSDSAGSSSLDHLRRSERGHSLRRARSPPSTTSSLPPPRPSSASRSPRPRAGLSTFSTHSHPNLRFRHSGVTTKSFHSSASAPPIIPRPYGSAVIVGKIEFDIDRRRGGARWFDAWVYSAVRAAAADDGASESGADARRAELFLPSLIRAREPSMDRESVAGGPTPSFATDPGSSAGHLTPALSGGGFPPVDEPTPRGPRRREPDPIAPSSPASNAPTSSSKAFSDMASVSAVDSKRSNLPPSRSASPASIHPDPDMSAETSGVVQSSSSSEQGDDDLAEAESGYTRLDEDDIEDDESVYAIDEDDADDEATEATAGRIAGESGDPLADVFPSDAATWRGISADADQPRAPAIEGLGIIGAAASHLQSDDEEADAQVNDDVQEVIDLLRRSSTSNGLEMAVNGNMKAPPRTAAEDLLSSPIHLDSPNPSTTGVFTSVAADHHDEATREEVDERQSSSSSSYNLSVSAAPGTTAVEAPASPARSPSPSSWSNAISNTFAALNIPRRPTSPASSSSTTIAADHVTDAQPDAGRRSPSPANRRAFLLRPPSSPTTPTGSAAAAGDVEATARQPRPLSASSKRSSLEMMEGLDDLERVLAELSPKASRSSSSSHSLIAAHGSKLPPKSASSPQIARLHAQDARRRDRHGGAWPSGYEPDSTDERKAPRTPEMRSASPSGSSSASSAHYEDEKDGRETSSDVDWRSKPDGRSSSRNDNRVNYASDSSDGRRSRTTSGGKRNRVIQPVMFDAPAFPREDSAEAIAGLAEASSSRSLTSPSNRPLALPTRRGTGGEEEREPMITEEQHRAKQGSTDSGKTVLAYTSGTAGEVDSSPRSASSQPAVPPLPMPGYPADDPTSSPGQASQDGRQEETAETTPAATSQPISIQGGAVGAAPGEQLARSPESHDVPRLQPPPRSQSAFGSLRTTKPWAQSSTGSGSPKSPPLVHESAWSTVDEHQQAAFEGSEGPGGQTSTAASGTTSKQGSPSPLNAFFAKPAGAFKFWANKNDEKLSGT
jgi:hypothetical protein